MTKTLFNTLVNHKANNNTKQEKIVVKLQNILNHLLIHDIKLFGVELFSTHVWFNGDFEGDGEKTIIPSQFSLNFMGFKLHSQFKRDVEVSPNRFETKGKCWHTQTIGTKWFRWLTIEFCPFFTKKEIKVLEIETDEVVIRKRKHKCSNGRWLGEWKKFIIEKTIWTWGEKSNNEF